MRWTPSGARLWISIATSGFGLRFGTVSLAPSNEDHIGDAVLFTDRMKSVEYGDTPVAPPLRILDPVFGEQNSGAFGQRCDNQIEVSLPNCSPDLLIACVYRLMVWNKTIVNQIGDHESHVAG